MAILEKLKKNKKEETSSEKKTTVKVSPKAEEKKDEKKSEVVVLKASNNTNKVLIRPIITEKANIAEGQNVYTFLVDKNANKIEIKKSISDLFGVLPLSVKTMNFQGKVKRFGKSRGRRSDFKKALVVLPKGKTISIHEGV